MTTGADKFLPALLADEVDTATSARLGTSCTANATPHTVGTIVEIDPSLSADADGIIVVLTTATNAATTNTSTILEILTGAGGAETVWASVLVGYRNVDVAINGAPIVVPGFIASGTRVSVRARSAVGSQVVAARYLFVAATRGVDYGTPATIGVNTGTSQGTTLTAPGSLNTKGAWTELVASSAAAYTAVAVTFQAAGGTTMNASGVAIDIGVGGAGSETVLVGDIVTSTSASEYYAPRGPVAFGVSIAAGTRISARYARANAGNAIDLALILTPAAAGDATVTGNKATETDTANAGAPVVVVAGSKATETDTANAGAALVGVLVAGSKATETDTANAGAALELVAGSKATETDTANAGTPSQGLIVTGNKATETDTANAGAALVLVTGSKATETDTANAGTPIVSGGDVTVTGSKATETDTANAGAALVLVVGGKATETDTANAGAALELVAGSKATETDTANVGRPLVLVAGSKATETDTARAGTALGPDTPTPSPRQLVYVAAPVELSYSAPATGLVYVEPDTALTWINTA